MAINEAIVTYFGQTAKANCDRNCKKAWGINNRPIIQMSNIDSDYAYLADNELGEAPADPGTYEGGEAKPLSPDEFPTKWCIRECERCEMSEPGKWKEPLQIRDFNKRRFNLYSRDSELERDNSANAQ